ncbi:MAG: GNAT family N-acetyltransferase [Chthoniobacterales bacterium]
MQIRRLTENDWILWKAFRILALGHAPEAFASSMEEEERLPDRQFQDWLRGTVVLGAFINGHLIGSAGFFLHEFSKERHRGVLFGVNVLPEHRNQGIARQLVQQVIDRAKNEVLQLHLKVISTNLAAISVYERCGFRFYGAEPRALKIGDRFYDENIMVLFFGK